jgi:threonine aldolase
MKKIDLRSDTVTQPSADMRQVMARAPVGDDQYAEDPSVNDLQDKVAEMLGKEAALFVATGTMANQIALKLVANPGEEVIVGDGSHIVWHEAGAAAVNAGVQFTVVGRGGLFDEEDMAQAVKPRNHMIFPATGAVIIENTHNRGGGVIFPRAATEAICKSAREMNLRTYCDGARLFNAAVASGSEVGELARPFDVVSVALSKGLGCPVGSVIAGSKQDIARANRMRRMFGGAWRQAGILAAAGIFALDRNIGRLAVDHRNARMMALRVAKLPGIKLDLATVKTNIVIFHLAQKVPPAADLIERARSRGVLLTAFGPRTVRLTTHLNVSQEDCEVAASVIAEIANSW